MKRGACWFQRLVDSAVANTSRWRHILGCRQIDKETYVRALSYTMPCWRHTLASRFILLNQLHQEEGDKTSPFIVMHTAHKMHAYICMYKYTCLEKKMTRDGGKGGLIGCFARLRGRASWKSSWGVGEAHVHLAAPFCAQSEFGPVSGVRWGNPATTSKWPQIVLCVVYAYLNTRMYVHTCACWMLSAALDVVRGEQREEKTTHACGKDGPSTLKEYAVGVEQSWSDLRLNCRAKSSALHG